MKHLSIQPSGYPEKPRRQAALSRVSSPIPAPGDLELIQAFLNTVTPKGDELDTPAHLSDWLSRNGLLPAGSRLQPADLERARLARAGLSTLAAANNGRPLDDAAIAGLDHAAVGARAQIRFDRDGTSRFELISRDLDDALGALFGIVHAARCEKKWPALKLCARPECRRAFYDFTKNLGGKWCTSRCGNRMRAKARRRRNAARS